jgi:hypothetical protein
MSTTDETKTGGDVTPPPKKSNTRRMLIRYGPIAVVIILIAAAVIAFGGGGGDDDSAQSGSDNINTDEQALIKSGPMTPQKADLEGKDVDFGPRCDTTTGRIMLVSVYAPPCVEPFTGDNGGDTAQGVTADSVKIVYYRADPALDPLLAATVEGAGADVDPTSADRTIEDYANLYNKVFETYGRSVDVEIYVGTGAGSDATAAKNDALAIAEKKPFAVIGGPAQSSAVFAEELASQGIVCGPGCAVALNEDIVNEFAPLLWQVGPTPNQAVQMAAEAIANMAGPGKATLAGDDATKAKDRVYGLLHYDTPDGDHQKVFESFKQSLADNGIDLATDIEFTLDLANAQENARTNISKLKEAGVTTIILYTDPFTPASLSKEATAQDYHPEWILGPNTLMDTTIFARQVDQEQWTHGFGVAFIGARGQQEDDGAFRIYDWAYGGLPPNNTANVLEPPLRTIFTGIHLAGPDLTVDAFRDGLLRAPPAGGGPTEPQVSRGEHGVWPDFDWGGSDDIAFIWWDPTATGEDEVGNAGTGMYRYALDGKRYTLGHMPSSTEDAGIFDVDKSVTVFDQVPEEDRTPDYPPPD